MKRIRPSPSFEILLPEDIVHQTDQCVSSFWLHGEPILLQISSYLRLDESQVPASQRLRERLAKSQGQWKVWDHSPLAIDGTEQATAETVDSEGTLWIHAYIVWPHLTVYATVSGPADQLRNRQDWAIAALGTMKLNIQ